MSNVEDDLDDGTDPDVTLTMMDFIEEEDDRELQAAAVLGPTDGDSCTYDQGYFPRQALYSCRTCQTDPTILAGVCVPCSYACHDGHDLVELYTKRNFRCDCGNSKFPEANPCKLRPDKDKLNEKNKYGHNFLGHYCICERPWPDPADVEDPSDPMLQCCVCEDWYHTRHLGTPCPPLDSFNEIICKGCSDKLPFLAYYSGLTVTPVSPEKEGEETKAPEKDAKEGIEGQEESKAGGDQLEVVEVPKIEVEKTAVKQVDVKNTGTVQAEKSVNGGSTESEALPGPSTSKDETPQAGPSQSSENTCLLEGRTPMENKEGATFWTSNFRLFFCTCTKCKAVYAQLEVPWITDKEDTVRFYEEKAVRVRENEYEKGLKALSTLPRTSQVECIHNYIELKTELKEYLSSFAASKKVVRKEDINNFFSELQARKRRRVDGAPPYACR